MLSDRLDGFLGGKNKVLEKVKESQYLLPGAPISSLSTLVGNALDRLQSAGDACVKYDTETKMWVYLHGDRTEESLTFYDIEGPAAWKSCFCNAHTHTYAHFDNISRSTGFFLNLWIDQDARKR